MATQFGPNIWELSHNTGTGWQCPPSILSKPLPPLRRTYGGPGSSGESNSWQDCLPSHSERNSPTPVFPRPLWGEGVIGSPVGASGGKLEGKGSWFVTFSYTLARSGGDSKGKKGVLGILLDMFCPRLPMDWTVGSSEGRHVNYVVTRVAKWSIRRGEWLWERISVLGQRYWYWPPWFSFSPI